jgi:hypothetical protein
MDDISLLRNFSPEPTIDALESRMARAALVEHIEGSTQPRRLAFLPGVRRPRARRSIAFAGALLLMTSVAVGAGVLTYVAEWGPVDHPATVASINQEIDDTMALSALPPGYSYPVAALRQWAEPAGNLADFQGVQSVQFHAMCAWTAYWLDGHKAGNGSQMALALLTIQEFPSWQSVSDPRLADDSIRQEVAAVVAGAQSNNAAPVELLYSGMMCDWALSR